MDVDMLIKRLSDGQGFIRFLPGELPCKHKPPVITKIFPLLTVPSLRLYVIYPRPNMGYGYPGRPACVLLPRPGCENCSRNVCTLIAGNATA